MSSEDNAFRWVEISGFRGFREHQRIELDASVIVVTGPNGTGKTSLFDALQWLLLGSLQRLEAWRVRKNAEHIVNAYAGSEPAVVEAELSLNGNAVRLRRQGRYDSSWLEWQQASGSLSGDEAERALRQALQSRPGQDIRKLITNAGLLQQDVVRDVLEDKPAERYKHLAALLGLDDLSAFEEAVANRAERLSNQGTEARQAVQVAENNTAELVDELHKREASVRLEEDVCVERDQILARIRAFERPVSAPEPPSSAAGAALLREAAETAAERLADLLSDKADLRKRQSNLSAPPPELADQLRSEVATKSEQLTRGQQETSQQNAALATSRERASALDALSAQALELLGPTCPVCGNDIDPEDVAGHLRARLESGASQELVELQATAAGAQEREAALQKTLTAAEAEVARVETARREADELDKAEARWSDACAGFSMPEGSPVVLGSLEALRAGDEKAITAAVGGLRGISALATELGAVLRSDVSETVLADLRLQIRRAQEVLSALKDTASQASLQEESAKGLRNATTRAVTAVTERRFKRLAPTVQDIFWRLSPHPSFTTLDFELDVYRRKGIASPVVQDETLPEMKADPLLVFSSSQANVTALSYFLALGWAAGRDGLPFVLLDDPLQSMDDVNALGFADLCRHIRRQRQLIVSTHDRRLASLLRRKLTPRAGTERTRVLEFRAWTRDGPEIAQRLLEPELTEGSQRAVVGLSAA